MTVPLCGYAAGPAAWCAPARRACPLTRGAGWNAWNAVGASCSDAFQSECVHAAGASSPRTVTLTTGTPGVLVSACTS